MFQGRKWFQTCIIYDDTGLTYWRAPSPLSGRVITCPKHRHGKILLSTFREIGLYCHPVGFELTTQLRMSQILREKGRDLTQCYDKSPFTHRKIQKATWQHPNDTKHFDYTTIEDRLRTVSWSNDSHPTGVVKPVYGIPTFPLTAKAD